MKSSSQTKQAICIQATLACGFRGPITIRESSGSNKKRKIAFYGFLIALIISFGYIKINKMNINELGLNFLSWIKKIKGDSVNLDNIKQETSKPMNHSSWDSLLQKNVSPNGDVDYKGFIKDSSIFQKYLEELSTQTPAKNWTKNEELAYWINAYNAYTVKLIIDHYPIKSIKDIGDGLTMISSPWDIKFFKIGNDDFDLNTIEHEILRKQFDEPRIHFAINCASISCPKLRNEAFLASKIELQLEAQAKEFINNPSKNIIKKNVSKLSKIFNWFQSDFLKHGPIDEFIKKHNSSFEKENKVEYMDYNWSLNEA